jgi:hypothetical protein
VIGLSRRYKVPARGRIRLDLSGSNREAKKGYASAQYPVAVPIAGCLHAGNSESLGLSAAKEHRSDLGPYRGIQVQE